VVFRKVGYRTIKAYHREPRISSQEWAEKNIVFKGTDISPITGQFNLKYSPHLRKLLDLSDVPSVARMFGKWASQSGKSLFEMIVAAKRLDTDPTNVLMMFPIKDDLPKYLRIKINPVLKCIPKLWQKFEDFKTDEGIRMKDTIKQIAGGSLIVSGAGVKDRKSLTVPMLVGDEIAEFDKGAFMEAEERLKSFSKFFPKAIGVSTIVHPEDEICTNHDSCNCLMEWQYRCPSCSDTFLAGSKHLKWISLKDYAAELGVKEESIPRHKYIERAMESGHVECPHCAYKIDTHEKDDMVINGGMEWVVVEGEEPSTSYGFSMNSLGSYFVTYGQIIDAIIKADGDEIKLDKIYRGWFNEFYEEKQENKTTPSDLLQLGNGLKEFVVPNDTVAMYMGVDTQKDHFWAKIVAFEYGMKRHTIWAGRLEDFKSIVDLMERTWYRENGSVYRQGIRRMGIDYQGYVKKETVFNDETNKEEAIEIVNRPQEVKDFVFEFSEYWGRDGEHERIYATRGHEFLPNDEPFAFTSTNLTANNYKDTRKVKVMKLGTVSLKLTLMQALYRTIEKINASETDTAYDYDVRLMYINQDIVDRLSNADTLTSEAYINQMTSEVYTYPLDARGNKKDRKSFVQVKKDNHLLDCGAICEALAQLDNIASLKKPVDESPEKRFSVSRSLM